MPEPELEATAHVFQVTLRNTPTLTASDRALVDYVIAHELTHLRHDDHGPAFWSALGRALPDYDERRARLRGLGPELIW
ncbi:MAG: M48 family metallopeptidase [Polyangiaceae bacterium]